MLTARLQELVAVLPPVAYYAALAFVAALTALAVSRAFRHLRTLRLIEDTPTARIGSAAQGFVELEGTAEPLRNVALSSPLRGVPCVWWSYRVEDLAVEDRIGTDVGTAIEVVAWLLRVVGVRRRGKLVEFGRSDERFLIRDGTGACLVDPATAHIVGARRTVWFAGDHRYEEAVIPARQPLYALGLLRTPLDHAAELERREAGALLSEWRLNQRALARRFDANGDGDVDDAELAAAWEAALAAVRKDRRALPPPELHVLCRPADRRPFTLSLVRQGSLARHFWLGALTGLLAAAIGLVLLLSLLGARGLV